MNIAAWFWIFMALLLAGTVYFTWGNKTHAGVSILVWLALAAIGWKVFGGPIRG